MRSGRRAVSTEALVLGLLSAVRTVPMAIVYALLSTERPRRLIAVYIGAGVAMSLVVGVAAVAVFEPDAGTREQTTGRMVLDLVLGVLAVGFAVVYGTGRIGGSSGGRSNPLEGSGPLGRVGERLRHPSPGTAATAGSVTNLPGVYFLAGLVAILSTQPSLVGGAVQVVLYTVLRFGGPIAVLVLVVLRPEDTARMLQQLDDWARRHRRALVGGLVGAVGVFLVVRSVVALV